MCLSCYVPFLSSVVISLLSTAGVNHVSGRGNYVRVYMRLKYARSPIHQTPTHFLNLLLDSMQKYLDVVGVKTCICTFLFLPLSFLRTLKSMTFTR